MRCSWWSTSNFLFFPVALLLCLDALRLSNRIILASAGPMCGCASHFDVLMDFFNATGGPTWTIRSGWGASLASPCTTSSWYGVTCVDGNITSLDLSGNNLKGTLPPSLGNLSQLQFLNLYINRISGTLPASYGQRLVSIQQISMHSNQFAGSLPDSWGALPRLTYLNLDFNRLNGTLPGEPWSTSSLLTSLSLNYNSLSGTLPESWGHSMSTMTYLQLTSNVRHTPLCLGLELGFVDASGRSIV
ncbi:GP46-like surface antigen, putative [Bodo saltans]|uniref:GP46-like surface antigen, putative n=1 Tax=Bodo saltans TaxID=75058 RepID=A0A0S4JUR5_BODSA|nr:GP46-like surface antigen, putative [Bodo saltans]|eukprot:CUG93979.1 GP46-like surface antigen, putative [Bodo saltans]